jgi:hypothetical protein
VEEMIPDCRVEYAEDAEPDKRSYRVDFSKLGRALPEFKPQWNAWRGVKQLYDAYLKISLCLEDFEGAKYKRIDHIKQLLRDGYLDSTLRWS